MDSRHYSLPEALPILRRDRGAEGPVESTPLLRQVPTGPLAAEVGAPTGNPSRIDDERAIDHRDPVQGRAGLDLAAADAAAQRLRTLRCYPPLVLPPPPREGQGGGRPQLPPSA